MTDNSLDPVALAQALIRRPSVTPADEGAMDVLQRQLEALGFNCRRMKFGEIENLYARRGTARPNLCFAGHTDVVPVGDDAAWTAGPFEAEIKDGVLLRPRGGRHEERHRRLRRRRLQPAPATCPARSAS